MIALRLGALAALRSRDTSKLALPLATLVMVCAATALLSRVVHRVHAVDHALAQNFGLWFPLGAYWLFHNVTERGRLETTVFPVLRHGGRRREALAGAALTLGGVLAAAGAGIAALSVTLTHGASDGSFVNDILLSSWVGALGGYAYACWLSFASGFGERGRRGVFMIFDLIFGSSSGVPALFFPRAHLGNLLGGEAPLALSQRASSGILLLGGALLLALALLRCPD
jgi:hypothetical protein